MLVIAAIDLIGGRCVRLLKGNYDHRTEYSVDPVEQAIFLQKVGFSRVHIVDLDGARLGKPQNFPIISQVVSTLDLSVQVGGGIRKSADVASLASLGCFLILGSSALLEPEKVGSWIKQWGSDRFIISLDLDGKDLRTHGWKKSAPMKLLEALDLIGMWGIKQIICTDITRDGTLIGPNLSLLEEDLLRLCFSVDSNIRKFLFENVKEDWLESNMVKIIYDKIYIHLHSEYPIEASLIMNDIPKNYREKLTEIIFDLEKLEASLSFARDCVKRLEENYIDLTLKNLRINLKKAEVENNDCTTIIKQIDDLLKKKIQLSSYNEL